MLSYKHLAHCRFILVIMNYIQQSMLEFRLPICDDEREMLLVPETIKQLQQLQVNWHNSLCSFILQSGSIQCGSSIIWSCTLYIHIYIYRHTLYIHCIKGLMKWKWMSNSTRSLVQIVWQNLPYGPFRLNRVIFTRISSKQKITSNFNDTSRLSGITGHIHTHKGKSWKMIN